MHFVPISKKIRRIAKPLICSFVAIFLGAGCRANFYVKTSDDEPKVIDQKALAAKVAKLEKITIPTGKKLTLLRTEVMVFGKGSTESQGGRFTYITDLPKDDIKNLKIEATQVWNVLRPRADKLGNASAVVTAQQRVAVDPQRDIHEGYTFGWRKQADGTWESLK